MMQPKLVLSPIDFSADSLEALDVAQDVATRYGSKLLLLHVVPVIPRLPESVSLLNEGDYEKEMITNSSVQLGELAGKLRGKGLQVRTATGLANDAAMDILLTAERENVDLIVMATHGMTGWRKLAFGSVTDKVVRMADCPVLVLRKSAAAQSEKAAAASA
jgi:nucleotide-binding universal stress UspA family protein